MHMTIFFNILAHGRHSEPVQTLGVVHSDDSGIAASTYPVCQAPAIVVSGL